jgi:hypothetical protein
VDLDGAPSFLVDKFLQPILKHHLSRRSRTRIEPPFEFLDANGMLDLGMLNLNRNGGLTAPDIFDPIVVAENFQCLRNRFIDAAGADLDRMLDASEIAAEHLAGFQKPRDRSR